MRDSFIFSGENGQSVSRWLRIVRQKIPVTTTPDTWLDIVDTRLEEEAARWTDTTAIICRMLAENAIDRATEADITRYKEAVIARFPPHSTKSKLPI